jgi:hypothetical protein
MHATRHNHSIHHVPAYISIKLIIFHIDTQALYRFLSEPGQPWPSIFSNTAAILWRVSQSRSSSKIPSTRKDYVPAGGDS